MEKKINLMDRQIDEQISDDRTNLWCNNIGGD